MEALENCEENCAGNQHFLVFPQCFSSIKKICNIRATVHVFCFELGPAQKKLSLIES